MKVFLLIRNFEYPIFCCTKNCFEKFKYQCAGIIPSLGEEKSDVRQFCYGEREVFQGAVKPGGESGISWMLHLF